MKFKLQWPSIIITAWVVLAATFQTVRIYPISYWMEPHLLVVSDSVVGVSPKIRYLRSIHRSFVGEWTVQVRRNGETGFSAFCSASGKNNYSPKAVVPSDADLNWLTWPTRCNLPVGRYYVEIIWTIELSQDTQKTASITSNQFEIKP